MAGKFKEVRFSTPSREVMVEITKDIKAVVREMAVRDGIVMVFSPHTTGGITLNENADPDVRRDLDQHLTKLIPRQAGFRHAEGNSDAHLKASLVGFSCFVPLVEGGLRLGSWQGIYFWEFDGPRQRRVWVQVIESQG